MSDEKTGNTTRYFDLWFRDQFGKLPNNARALELERDIASAHGELAALEAELAQLRTLSAQYTAVICQVYASTAEGD